MNKDILKPLYEFGALIKFCEENDLTKESLLIHTDMADLSGVYYKVLNNLSGANLHIFEAKVQEAYDRLLSEME